MVMDKNKYLNFLQHPESISYSDTLLLEKIIKKYPYFQSALALYVKTLKKNHILHNRNLYKVAALTTDRTILFRFFEDIESFEEPKTTSKTSVSKDIMLSEDKEFDNKKNNISDFTKETTDETLFLRKETEKSVEKEEISKENTLPDKLTFSEWMKFISGAGDKKAKKQDPIFELIDKFLKDKPKIVPKRNHSIPPPENVIKSVEEKQMLMTETLANLYVKQKKYDKAIQAFKILSLKYPKKSSYFANQINELKKQIKK